MSDLERIEQQKQNRMELERDFNEVEAEEEWRGVYPGMCVDPEICRGYTHCPRQYSCSE